MDKMIGLRIKKRRKELHITQKDIEANTSISSGNLSCIENGKYLPSATACIELSNVLQCTTDWILKGITTDFIVTTKNQNNVHVEYEPIPDYDQVPERLLAYQSQTKNCNQTDLENKCDISLSALEIELMEMFRDLCSEDQDDILTLTKTKYNRKKEKSRNEEKSYASHPGPGIDNNIA